MRLKHALAACLTAALTFSTGCGGGFFLDNTGTTTTPSTAGNYVYAVNAANNSIVAYSLSGGTLTSIATALVAPTGLAASSIAVSRGDAFVYVGGSQAISLYKIGSTGALTLSTATAATAQANFISLETSPDGKWLLALDSQSYSIYCFGINTSSGALTLTATAGYVPAVTGNTTVTPRMLRISANGTFVAAALGVGGDVIFPFNTATGALGSPQALPPLTYSDNAVQFDNAGAYLYVARSNSTSGASILQSYLVGAGGSLTSSASVTAGNGPYALLLENGGTYLYSANRADATLSGFSTSAGAFTVLPGSPYASGTLPTVMVEDRTHKYIVTAGSGGGADLTVYGLDALTAGKLNALSTVTSGAAGLNSISATY